MQKFLTVTKNKNRVREVRCSEPRYILKIYNVEKIFQRVLKENVKEGLGAVGWLCNCGDMHPPDPKVVITILPPST